MAGVHERKQLQPQKCLFYLQQELDQVQPWRSSYHCNKKHWNYFNTNKKLDREIKFGNVIKLKYCKIKNCVPLFKACSIIHTNFLKWFFLILQDGVIRGSTDIGFLKFCKVVLLGISVQSVHKKKKVNQNVKTFCHSLGCGCLLVCKWQTQEVYL